MHAPRIVACCTTANGALHYLTMPGKRGFDEQIAALDKLRQLPAESCIDPLRTALEQRNNFVVG